MSPEFFYLKCDNVKSRIHRRLSGKGNPKRRRLCQINFIQEIWPLIYVSPKNINLTICCFSRPFSASDELIIMQDHVLSAASLEFQIPFTQTIEYTIMYTKSCPLLIKNTTILNKRVTFQEPKAKDKNWTTGIFANYMKLVLFGCPSKVYFALWLHLDTRSRKQPPAARP